MENKTKFITQTAIIAALYAGLTFLAAFLGLAYGPIQFRFSEALTILPILTPCAVLGLSIGCFISNLASPLGAIDLIFGTLATLISAILTRNLRNFKFKGVPILAPLPSVIVNAIFVGLIVAFTGPEQIKGELFFSTAAWVALSQFIVCYFLGLPLLKILEKTKIFKKF